MAPNTDPIVPQVRRDFEALVAYVSGPASAEQDVYTVELHLFRRLLALGALLLKLFFRTRAATRPAAPSANDGTLMAFHSRRSIRYISIFGELWCARHYFTAPGKGSGAPLDSQLSLPQTAYSDLLREWAAYGATEQAYRENQTLLQRLLGLTVPVATLEQQVSRSAQDVAAFYVQHQPAPPAPNDRILVVQADGKGVPLVSEPAEQPVRLGKGQKRGTKKEAVVTCLYTIAPYPRTPGAVVAALLHEQAPPADPRPRPSNKEQHASLAGKAAACRSLAARAKQREHVALLDQVALTDGSEALQGQMQAHFASATLVLDIIHATEYLWDAATGVLGENSPDRVAWLRPRLLGLLEGRTSAVIDGLEREKTTEPRTASQCHALERTIGYYRRNQAYMHYDQYLAKGWPIGTGAVEGACAHLVKDRMEQAGMRWRVDGAQVVLDLRAVRLNGDWDAYWQFHRQQEHQRLYATPAPPVPEQQLTALAA
jgi:hypothetical protein